MYASYFGLREMPFNNTPDPRFFFSTPEHEEALAQLIYAIGEGKGFVLLTGEIGAGKTLITRLMLRHFGDRIDFACINQTQVSAHELLRCICAEFSLDVHPDATNAEIIRHLQDFLLERFAANQPVVLMLDEAQALSREAFEQVRMIGNLEADDAKLLQIVIVGQPELRERFDAADMRQLRQRIFRRFHLSGLTRDQTEGYIRHRLSVAGGRFPDRILEASAIDAIFAYTQGLPRLINTVCDNAMLSAYAADAHVIDGAFVKETLCQMESVAVNPTVTVPARLDDVTRTPPAPVAYSAIAEASTALTAPGDGYRGRQAVSASASLERLLREAVEVENSLRSVLADTRHASPQIEETKKVAILARRLLGEARAAAGEVREVVNTARTMKTSLGQAMDELGQQSARCGRLSVRLREVFDRLEQRAGRLQRRVDRVQAAGGQRGAVSPAVARVQDHAANFDRMISGNRQMVDEVRAIITAADDTAPAHASPLTATSAAVRASAALADEVFALADMVETARRPETSPSA